MYSPVEIQSYAKRISSEQEELISIEKIFRNEVNNITAWWEGIASKSFIQQYDRIENEINKMYSYIYNLEDNLRKLANEVVRAEEERRKKELERIRRAQME